MNHENLNKPQNPILSKGDILPRELSLHNYWDSKTSEDRVEIVERAFKMIEKQKEYIAVLNEELNGREQLRLAAIVKSLPDPYEISMKARKLNKKDFEQWWWETVYKGNVL